MTPKSITLSKLAAFIASIFLSMGALADPASVRIEQGELKGLVTDHRQFRGIPFAAPPVGKLRFAAPTPAAGWKGERDASVFGSPCPQLGGFTGLGSENEDCLSLNVFTPLTGEKLPVMVWIYGGGLTSGSSASYDLSTVVKKGNVVAVSMNYRLGILGFLATQGLADEAGGMSGNYGLLDQQLALRWIKDNIANFGGDPNNVTIFGESAGGRSVCGHLLAPRSSGLFHRAIIQSGPCASSIYTPEASYKLAKSYAAATGCSRDNPAQEVACLRELPVEKLLNAQGSANIISSDMSPRFNADGVTISTPQQAFASGKFNRVPVLKGSNQFEGRFITALLFDLAGKRLNEEIYAQILTEKFGAADAKKILAQYPPSKYPSLSEALAAVYGDSSYSCPTYSDIRHLAESGVPVYSYEFREPNPPSLLPIPLGATHATELAFMLQAPEGRMAATRLNPGQLRLSDQMISYWVNFARNGDPNGESLPQWKPYDSASDNFFSLTTDESGLRDYLEFKADHSCDFWSALGV